MLRGAPGKAKGLQTGGTIVNGPCSVMARALAGTGLVLMFASAAAAQDNTAQGASAPPVAAEPGIAQDTAQDVAAAPLGSGDIVITARRRAEALLDVPVSVTAFSQAGLDRIGAREVDDIARLTPGVRFERETFGPSNRSSIAIRGVSSSVGAGTVGVYIDDTPIQIRNIYYTTTNAYPRLFDLERVEILRGPQGTLFGAGSEGGTVRFITPAPNLTKVGGYGRAEVAFTEHGDPSYEAGVALNVPIATDKAAVRASIWHRRDGGWIDRVGLDDPSQVLGEDDNYGSTTVARIAVALAPTETLTLTPSFFYQDQRSHGGSSYWLSLSDPDEGLYRNASPLPSTSKDQFGIGALAATWDIGPVEIVSNTSYFKRNSDVFPDYTGTGLATLTGSALPPFPGAATPAKWLDDQENFTQEVRVQSNDPNASVSWVAGVFYSHSKQRSQQLIGGQQLERLLEYLYGFPITVEEAFGQGLYQGEYSYATDDHTVDEQIAGFGQIDIKATDRLTLTAGLRVSGTKFSFVSATDGPYLGTSSISGSTNQTPVTPKFGISYKVGDNGLLYASASKGFRVGGAQRPAPVTCADDLEDLGISQIPRTYDSDSVWSYELGAKGAVLDRKLQFESSVFQVDWKNIQQSVSLPGCNLSYIDNLGSARSRGFDLSLTARPVPPLTLGLAVGYTHADYLVDVPAAPPLFIVRKGDTLGQRPWTVYANAQYDTTIGAVDAYARVDYSYESKNGRSRPADRVDYDPLIPRPPETHQVSLRAGGRLPASTPPSSSTTCSTRRRTSVCSAIPTRRPSSTAARSAPARSG